MPLLLLPTLVAATQMAADACPARAAPPAELADWERPAPATDTVAVGKAATVPLAPVVRWTVAPGKPPAAGSRGAAIRFIVATPGTYRVAIGAPAWIDVVEGGTALASKAHAHGPACSGVGKMVDFMLAKGPHVLQLSGSSATRAEVMIVPIR